MGFPRLENYFKGSSKVKILRTEMSTKNLPGGKGPPARKADNLTAICEKIF
jgi:hypothetical protein